MKTSDDLEPEPDPKELENLCAEQSNGLKHTEIENPQLIDPKKAPFHSFYGIFFTLISALFLSLSNVFIKKAELLTGTEQTAVRYLVQIIIMFAIIYRKNFNLLGPAKQRKLLILRGIMGMLGLTATHLAVKFINPSDAVAVTRTNVIIVSIFARFFLNEKFSFVHIASILMAVSGILF